jgi:ATP-dependent protease ClpP protease subunit
MAAEATFGKRKTPPPAEDGGAIESRREPLRAPTAPEPSTRSPPVSFGRNHHDVESGRAPAHPTLRVDGLITAQTVDALHAQLLALAGRRVYDVALVVNSQGGQVLPALRFYERVKFLPLRVRTHADGAVCSAANLLFLVGEERTASRDARFLFHPVVSEISGRLSRDDFAKTMQEMARLESAMSRVLFERTALPSAVVERFHHETIVFDAPTALRFGLIHRIETFESPDDDCAAARE